MSTELEYDDVRSKKNILMDDDIVFVVFVGASGWVMCFINGSSAYHCHHCRFPLSVWQQLHPEDKTFSGLFILDPHVYNLALFSLRTLKQW